MIDAFYASVLDEHRSGTGLGCRAAFADFLEETGAPRAEFIRAQLAVAPVTPALQMPSGEVERMGAAVREDGRAIAVRRRVLEAWEACWRLGDLPSAWFPVPEGTQAKYDRAVPHFSIFRNTVRIAEVEIVRGFPGAITVPSPEVWTGGRCFACSGYGRVPGGRQVTDCRSCAGEGVVEQTSHEMMLIYPVERVEIKSKQPRVGRTKGKEERRLWLRGTPDWQSGAALVRGDVFDRLRGQVGTAEEWKSYVSEEDAVMALSDSLMRSA